MTKQEVNAIIKDIAETHNFGVREGNFLIAEPVGEYVAFTAIPKVNAEESNWYEHKLVSDVIVTVSVTKDVSRETNFRKLHWISSEIRLAAAMLEAIQEAGLKYTETLGESKD